MGTGEASAHSQVIVPVWSSILNLVWHVMFMSIVLVNIATAEGLDNGDPLLALAITLGFIFSATAFFRLQKHF